MGGREFSENEVQILKYLVRHSGQDIYQSQLSKDLNLDPRIISKTLIKLEELGAVERASITYGGRKTFLIKPVREKLVRIMEEAGVDPYSLEEIFNDVADIPCIKCPYIYKCYEGGYYDPASCQWLTDYLRRKAGTHDSLVSPRSKSKTQGI